MPWRRAAVEYPGRLPWGEGHRASLPEDPDDLMEIAYSWFGDPPNQEYYSIFAWSAPAPERLRLKGGPADPMGPWVRTGPEPKTLRRWERNRRMQEVASAQYPRLTPEEAVREWWRHGGSMQPLRWSDEHVAEFRADVATRLVGQLGGLNVRDGEAVLMVGGTSPEVRSPRTKAKELARKRERYAASRREAGLPYRPRSRK